jgi:choline dehydrogenase
LFQGGFVTLNSSDPLAPPLIDPNLLGSEVDIFIMREAIKSSLRFAAAPAWTDYIISPVSFNSSSTDEELDAYIRANAGTVFHPTGTAGMSPEGAKYGVVDPDLRVKGLNGLRVVDVSVLVRFSILLGLALELIACSLSSLRPIRKPRLILLQREHLI